MRLPGATGTPEPGIGSGVGIRLHRGPVARVAASLLRADAFVLGHRIYLSAGAADEIGRGSARGRRILAHELAHVRQYRELGIARFLAVYAADYLRARAGGASHGAAYASIRFEREAFSAGDRSATGAEIFQNGDGDGMKRG